MLWIDRALPKPISDVNPPVPGSHVKSTDELAEAAGHSARSRRLPVGAYMEAVMEMAGERGWPAAAALPDTDLVRLMEQLAEAQRTGVFRRCSSSRCCSIGVVYAITKACISEVTGKAATDFIESRPDRLPMGLMARRIEMLRAKTLRSLWHPNHRTLGYRSARALVGSQRRRWQAALTDRTRRKRMDQGRGAGDRSVSRRRPTAWRRCCRSVPSAGRLGKTSGTRPVLGGSGRGFSFTSCVIHDPEHRFQTIVSDSIHAILSSVFPRDPEPGFHGIVSSLWKNLADSPATRFLVSDAPRSHARRMVVQRRTLFFFSHDQSPLRGGKVISIL